MADTLDPRPVVPGSEQEAHNAFLKLMEPVEETPEEQDSEPTEDVEESTEETQDEPLEEEEGELEEESEEESEDEPESDEDEEVEKEEVYTVKVDGQEIEVSLDELVKGYSRQSDYTRKTQELAQQRNEIDAMKQHWSNEILQSQAERQQYIEAIGQIIQNQMPGLERYSNINWEQLREEDPIEFVAKKEEFREAQEKIRFAQSEQTRAQEQQYQELQRIKSMALQEERGRLMEAVPELSDPEKRQKITQSMAEYALSSGFTQEELSELIDHRQFIVLMKAQKYDAMQKSDVKSKKIKNKPKVVRSGQGANKKTDTQRSKRIASMKRLKETGRAQDAASLFEDFVDL